MRWILTALMASTLFCGTQYSFGSPRESPVARSEAHGQRKRPSLVVPERAVETVEAGGGQVVAKSAVPVTSLGHGLRLARAISPNRIVAMREIKGCFFYATVAPGDEREKHFISGYAIKRNGRQLVEISVW